MNVSRRRYMGSKGGSPSYQRIGYIESTGTQWIESGITPDNNPFVLESKIMFTVSNLNGCVCGLNLSANNVTYRYIPLWGYNGQVRCVNFSGTYADTKTAFFTGVKNIQYVVTSTINPSIPIVGIKYNTSSTISKNFSEGWNLDGTLAILARKKDKNEVNALCSGRLYYMKMYKNNVLVLDLIPVRIGTTGYMYDTVSGQLFGNSGTGDFVLGPDVTDE